MPIHFLLRSRYLRWSRITLESSTAAFVEILYDRKGLPVAVLTFTGLFWPVLSSSKVVLGKWKEDFGELPLSAVLSSHQRTWVSNHGY